MGRSAKVRKPSRCFICDSARGPKSHYFHIVECHKTQQLRGLCLYTHYWTIPVINGVITIHNLRSWSTHGTGGNCRTQCPNHVSTIFCWGCWICFQVIFYGFYHGKAPWISPPFGEYHSFFLSMKQAESKVGECWLNKVFQKDLFFWWQEMSVGEQGQATGGCEWATVAFRRTNPEKHATFSRLL